MICCLMRLPSTWVYMRNALSDAGATHGGEDLASQGQKIKQQDVSSWLTGIQEVPLSLQYKMRNIDETEAAKKRLLADAAPE